MRNCLHYLTGEMGCGPWTPSHECGSGAPASEFVSGQQRIHRPRSEAFQIECHELESQFFEDGCELTGHLGRQSARKFLSGDFNTHNIAVMTHAELAKSESTYGVFSALDNLQRLRRHRAAVFNSRGETCGSGLVPHSEACLASQVTDLSLAKPGLNQRRQNVMLARRFLPRTEVALIISIDTISNRIESMLGSISLHYSEQLVLAMEATHGVIAGVVGIFQLPSLDHLQRNSALTGKCEGVF